MTQTIVLTKKANPENMRESQKRDITVALHRLGASRRPVVLEKVAKSLKVKATDIGDFKKKIRAMRRENLLKTRKAA